MFRFIKKYRVRFLLCGVLIAGLYVTPELTQAQYKWTLNGYNILQAKAFYFDGDVLHDSSRENYNRVTGWDGMTRPISDIQLRNFENALLCNGVGEDLYYELTWSIKTFDAEKNEIMDSRACRLICGSTPEAADAGAISITGNKATSHIMGDGSPKKDIYHFTVQRGEEALTPGCYVQIYFYAKNYVPDAEGESGGGNLSYQRELDFTYEMVVSTMEGFVKSFDPFDEENKKKATLKIGTDGLPDINATSQRVTVWWDADALEVNTSEKDFQVAKSQGGFHAVTDVPGRNLYSIRLSDMGSGAIRELSFYKKTFDGLTSNDHWFTQEFIERSVVRNTSPDEANENQILGFYIEE